MYGTMINSARIWDGTLRERRDFLPNCLSLTSLVITALPKGEININSISCKGIELSSHVQMKYGCTSFHILSSKILNYFT